MRFELSGLLALPTGIADIRWTDVSSEASVDSFVGQAAATFGRIDYACNVAAVLMPSSSLQPSVADFDKLFAATTRSTQICQQAQLNQMARQEPFRADDDLYPQRGSIVNILSVCGLRGSDDLHQYCAAKHLITDLTQSDALKVAKYYIRINAIYPGVIRTASLGEPDDDHESVMDDLVSKIAVGRMGLPEEVAEAALFLTSGKASLITAATLAVDGGMQELRSK